MENGEDALVLYRPTGLLGPQSVENGGAFEVAPRDVADALASNSRDARAIGRQAAF